MTSDSKRYDKVVDQPHLSERDDIDKNLVLVGMKLREAVNTALPCDEILARFPRSSGRVPKEF